MHGVSLVFLSSHVFHNSEMANKMISFLDLAPVQAFTFTHRCNKYQPNIARDLLEMISLISSKTIWRDLVRDDNIMRSRSRRGDDVMRSRSSNLARDDMSRGISFEEIMLRDIARDDFNRSRSRFYSKLVRSVRSRLG